MLQIENIFIKPHSGADAIRASIERRKFEVREGDLLTLLNVFIAFQKNINNAKAWCSQRFINYKALKRAWEIKSQIIRLLDRFGIPKTSCQSM